MATAWIESEDPYDWGRLLLDEHNYSCQQSSDGLHDWGQQSTNLVYCETCGQVA